MDWRQLRASQGGYTLIEVIIVTTVIVILAGAALGMMRSGSSSAASFRYLFNTQTQLTRVVKEISYGYGASQGAAGAREVKVNPDGLEIDGVAYVLQNGTLKRKRSGKESVVLKNVDKFEAKVESDEGRKVLSVTITTRGKQSISVHQRVFLRGVSDA